MLYFQTFPLTSGEIWPLSYYSRWTSACLNFNDTPLRRWCFPFGLQMLHLASGAQPPGWPPSLGRWIHTIAEAGARPSPQFCGQIEPPNSSKNHIVEHVLILVHILKCGLSYGQCLNILVEQNSFPSPHLSSGNTDGSSRGVNEIVMRSRAVATCEHWMDSHTQSIWQSFPRRMFERHSANSSPPGDSSYTISVS